MKYPVRAVLDAKLGLLVLRDVSTDGDGFNPLTLLIQPHCRISVANSFQALQQATGECLPISAYQLLQISTRGLLPNSLRKNPVSWVTSLSSRNLAS